MIDKFIYGFIDRVYGAEDYTQQEINAKLIQKIDEVIENCNNAFEFVDWLKEQGVPDEVQTIINTMLEDGTLEDLINLEKLNQLESNLNNSIVQLTTSTQTKLDKMTTDVNELINENKETINQNKTELNNTITDFKEEANNTIINLKEEINADITRFKNIIICTNLEEFKNAITSAEQKPTDIYLVSGEYTLDSIIYIPSNTKIIGLGNVTIKGTGLNAYFINKTNGQAIEYNGTKNIRIENITFDGLDNASGLTLIGIGHAENVTIENCRFKNLHKWHMIEFNAVKQGYIKNCSFENYGTSGNGATEAVQLDSMISSEQFPWFGNYDNTANKFIIIEGNHFTNIGARAIGNHSFKAGIVQTDIHILNNEFDAVKTAIWLSDFYNLNVKGNSSVNCETFFRSDNMENTSLYLNIIGNSHKGNYTNNNDNLVDVRFVEINREGANGDLRISYVNITNNHIMNCPWHGIGYTADYVTIANNKFYNIAKNGVYHYGGVCATITGNIFRDVGKVDGFGSIMIGNNANFSSRGVTVNGNVMTDLGGIKVKPNSSGIIVSNNVGPVTNEVDTACTVVNNISMT